MQRLVIHTVCSLSTAGSLQSKSMDQDLHAWDLIDKNDSRKTAVDCFPIISQYMIHMTHCKYVLNASLEASHVAPELHSRLAPRTATFPQAGIHPRSQSGLCATHVALQRRVYYAIAIHSCWQQRQQLRFHYAVNLPALRPRIRLFSRNSTPKRILQNEEASNMAEELLDKARDLVEGQIVRAPHPPSTRLNAG